MKSFSRVVFISLMTSALVAGTVIAQQKPEVASRAPGVNNHAAAKANPSGENFASTTITKAIAPSLRLQVGGEKLFAGADQSNANLRARMDGAAVAIRSTTTTTLASPVSGNKGVRRTVQHPLAIPFPELPANHQSFRANGHVPASLNTISALGDPVNFDFAIAAGATYLRHAQSDVTEDNAGNGDPDGDNNDGGWDWVLTLPAITHSTDPSPKNIYGATAMGLYYAYLRSNTPSVKTAMQDAADKMVTDASVKDARAIAFLMLFNDLPGIVGTTYKDGAKVKYDAQLSAHGGTATLFAQFVRDTRGISQGYHNGIIGWDLGAWTVSAQMLYGRFGGSYNSDAVDIADVAYAASFVSNTDYFDLVRCAGWDPSYLNADYYWYNLGVSGLIDAFRASGTHASDIPGLVLKLQDSQTSFGAICGSYGVHLNDDDWQSTAYAVMALHSLDASTYAAEINHGSYYLAATQDATGGWVYSDNTHYPEVGGECTTALYSGQAATTVWVDDDFTSSSAGGHLWGYDAFATIQNGIDAVGLSGTVNVYPGNYNETAGNRYLFDGSGPYQFGLFIDTAKSGITIQGIDGGGSPVTDASATAANVQTNATNSFGYSGVFVEGDNVTITGIKILPNIAGDNKTIEVIGDNFVLKYSRFAIPPEGGSVYFNDWRFDVGLNTSHLKAYRVEANIFDDGTSVDLASGAGFSGPTSGRVIQNNIFGVPAGLPYASISFSGSGTLVPWYVYSVGGALIQGNIFTSGEQYIRARGTYDNTQFNWSSYWSTNTFTKGVIVGANPPADVRSYSYTSGPYTFNDVRRIGAFIQPEIDHALSGDIVLVKAGTYSEGSPQIVINTNVSVIGENKVTTIIVPAQNTGNSGDGRGWFLVNPGFTFNLSNVTLDGIGKLVNIAILSHGPGVIDNNIFKNLGYNPSGPNYAGRAVAFYDVNMSVTNNQLSNIGRIGLYTYGTGASNGVISGNTYTGKGNGDWLDYGIEVEGGAHATISNNMITACTGVASVDGSTSAGMLITTYFALGSQATLTGNTFSGNTVGVNVGYATDDQSTVVAHGNIISGNTDYGVLTTNPFVDATLNDWGSLFGPQDILGTIEVPFSPKPSVAEMQNAVPSTGLGNAVTENVDYYPWTGINATGDTAFYRSFTYDSLAYARDLRGKLGKPVAQRPDKVQFCLELRNRTGQSIDAMRISLRVPAFVNDPYYPFVITPTPRNLSFSKKNSIADLDWSTPIGIDSVIRICGWGVQPQYEIFKIAWISGGANVTRFYDNIDPLQFQVNDLKWPMPNEANITSELFYKSGFGVPDPTSLTVGIPKRDSAKYYGWVTMRKPSDAHQSFIDRLVKHSIDFRGFDRFDNRKPFIKERKKLTPRLQNNHIFANVATLKINIAASASGITPYGFGELIYDDGTNPLSGLTLRRIASKADSALTMWRGMTLGDYHNFDSVISKINIAFSGPMDTIAFSMGLRIKGVRRLQDVPYLRANPNIEPGIIPQIGPPRLSVPEEFALMQNYPNPFNPSTTIQFDLPTDAVVTLKVYNLLGQEVTTLLDREQFDAGTQELDFDAGKLASGVYFYRMTASEVTDEGNINNTNFTSIKKMVLIK